MSERRRRQCRVQGACATPGKVRVSAQHPTEFQIPCVTAQSPVEGNCGQLCARGATLIDGKHFKFQDPRTALMPGCRPPNFSWVVPGVLAGCGLPTQAAHLHYMVSEGIRHLVSLTEWRPPLHTCANLNHVHMPVEEFEAPSVKQAIDFVTLVEQAASKAEPVTVHCHWGLGRTGTMLACYLVKAEGLSPDEAIQKVRSVRRHSIETQDQERLVHQYARRLQAHVET